MKLHLNSSATRLRDKFSSRSVPIRLVALGVAVVFTAGQMQAQGPMVSSADNVQPAASVQQATTAAQAAPPARAETEISAPQPSLPEAPNALDETASTKVPLDLRAMMQDSAQASQSSQPAPAKKKHTVHYGLFIGGGVCLALGSYIFARAHGPGVAPAGGTLVAVGAGLTGLGLVLTLK